MKKRRFTFDISKILFKIKEVVDYLAIIGVFFILLFQIDSIRKLCKEVCVYVTTWYIKVDLLTIKNAYFAFEGIFRLFILVSVISSVILFAFRTVCDLLIKSKTGENRFEESLFRYLKNATVARCFLVTGDWGSGKTYDVNNFFEKYYKYSKKKIYRISCFGLSSRKELVEEINTIIEQEDSTFYAQIIKVLQYLPVIGDAINKFLKKTYSYSSIRKGSIFIFDDFERITSRYIDEKKEKELYRHSPFLFHSSLRNNHESQLEEIKKEFESIGKAFYQMQTDENNKIEQADANKYIAIIGFINELIETYQMKVVIICNSDILGEKFIHDVLRSKLNCIEYKKTMAPEVKLSLINSIMKNKAFEDETKYKLVCAYLDQVKCILCDMKIKTRLKDLRLFGGVIEAFLSTAMLFEKEQLDKHFLNSLLNSIMVAHVGYFHNSINKLNAYINGSNMEFMFSYLGGPGRAVELVRLDNCVEEIKWVDVTISGYWIFNLLTPNMVTEIKEEWSVYKYCELERNMLENAQCLSNAEEYSLLHMLAYVKEKSREEIWNLDSSFFEVALQEFNFKKIENVQYVLDMMYVVLDDFMNDQVNEYIFNILASGKAEGQIESNSYIHHAYIEFLKREHEIK